MSRKTLKKKRKTKNKKSKLLSYIAWGLSIVALMMGALIGGYYIGYDEAKDDIKTKHSKLSKVDQKKLEILKKKEKKSVNKRLQEVLKKEKSSVDDKIKKIVKTKEKIQTKYISASHELDTKNLPAPPKRDKKVVVGKPKLAIIIDDVSVKSQVDAIKRLKIPLTMSFLPPSKYRPNSPKLAAKESFYMVHLPMEAQNFTKEEPFTLRINDSQDKIYKRISRIKQLFPKVHYINNHTGSKFTSDEIAVNRLVYTLKKLDIYFIDSRTTAQTKVPKVMKNYGLRYVARDVFLDHHMEKEYVKKQIKQAIKIAKKHGSAIAIGHPHKNTLAALKESKALFKDVELVLVDGLY